ncbi:MAG: sigma-70 family RNA polymerase sigma factor [Acidimicrobiales bacterium]
MTDQLRAQAAFERYVVPELPVLLRVARSLTRQDSAAEDLVQDTLLRAFRAIDSFDGRYPRAWLLTIMRNTHINSHRRRRPELLYHADDALEVVADDDAPLFDDAFDAAVQAALDQLTKPFRLVVELVDIRGLSYAEAAIELGVPIGTIMSRLHRARRRMRDHLEGAGVSRRSEL